MEASRYQNFDTPPDTVSIPDQPLMGERKYLPGWSSPLTVVSKQNMDDGRPDPTLKGLLQDQYRWIFVGGKVLHSPHRPSPPPPGGPLPDLLCLLVHQLNASFGISTVKLTSDVQSKCLQ